MKQILIVDDDVSIGDMLEEILTKEGYGVSRAYSGTEALLLLSLSRPDLVLLDLMLPGERGRSASKDQWDSGNRAQRESGCGQQSRCAAKWCGRLHDKAI